MPFPSKIAHSLCVFALIAPSILFAQGKKKVEIRDPNMNNMVAYTLVIPANWNFKAPSCSIPTAEPPPTPSPTASGATTSATASSAQGEQFIANMQAQGDKRNADFAAYEDSRTRHTADQVDAILDRQYYVDPSNGQTSTISTTYTNNWSNGQGDKVLTNIQGYDPNGYVQGNWTQLQPIKH